ncbi:MAG: BBE domain-containing protein, partial [Gammaproteobacteria bacterium]|nr:BBE domain-containing protein [Gammaproteobacteria bacterium]
WLGMIGGWRDPAENEERLAAMRASWKHLEPITDGFYNNLAGEASGASLRANFGGNYDRLVALKAKYDPMNLFRLNANIPTKA